MVRFAFFSVPIWDEEPRWIQLSIFLQRHSTRAGWAAHRRALRFVIENEMIYHFEWWDKEVAMVNPHFRSIAVVEYVLVFYHDREAALFRLFYPGYLILS